MKVGILLLVPIFAFIWVTFIGSNNVSVSTTQPWNFTGSYSVNNQFGVNNIAISGLTIGAVAAAILIGTALAGINIFGSGLSPESVHLIYQAVTWMAIYAAIGIPAFLTFTLMPYGTLIFSMLSLMYLLGVLGQASRGT